MDNTKPRPAVFVAPPPPDTPPSPAAVYEQTQGTAAAAAAAAHDRDEDGERNTSDGEIEDYGDSSREAGLYENEG